MQKDFRTTPEGKKMKCKICGRTTNKYQRLCLLCDVLKSYITIHLENAKKIIFPYITADDFREDLAESVWIKVLQWCADNCAEDFLHLIDLEVIEEFVDQKRR